MEIPTVERTVRVKTQQVILPDLPITDGLPIRRWCVELYLVNEHGYEVEAGIFESCVYMLHPSFEQCRRKMSAPPFTLEEQGWGEFEMSIALKFKYSGGKVLINHSLLFDMDAYDVDLTIQVPYHNELLRKELLDSGPVPRFIYEEGSDQVRQRVPAMAEALVHASEETLGKVVKVITSQHAVREALLRRVNKSEEFILYLGQLPNSTLEQLQALL